MDFLKKSARGLAFFFFIILLFVTALVAAVVMTFNSPKKIEKSLSESGVYKTFISGALTEAKKANEKNIDNKAGEVNLPIDNPAIINAANKAFTPEVLQTNTEKVLDGSYDWLSGKTSSPNFTVDLTKAKQTFATAVGKAARDRLAKLPVCTLRQLKTLNSKDDIDPFSLPCRPPNTNLAKEQAKVTHDLATSKDFLSDPKITANELKNCYSSAPCKAGYNNLSSLPTIYKWVNTSPWLLALLALLTGLAFYFLHESKRRAARNLAIATTIIGGLLLISFFSFSAGWHNLSQPNSRLGQAVQGSFQLTTINAIGSIFNEFERVILWFGLAYLVTGIGGLIALRLTQPKNPISQKDESPTSPANDSSKLAKPTSKQRSI